MICREINKTCYWYKF